MEDDSRHISRFERRRRRLPHWEEPGATYFLTFTLRRPPAVDLTQPELATAIIDALLFHDCKRYTLYDYTVMSDHVHVILQPVVTSGKTERLSRIVHGLKSWLSNEINRLVGRTGVLWQDETYDHIIRDDADYQEKAGYIWDNPHRDGLVPLGEEWPWWGKGSGRHL